VVHFVHLAFDKKSRSAIPSRDGGGSASRLHVLKPLACRGPRKDRDDVTGYTVDVAITGFVPRHHEPSEALIRIVDQVHQSLHFPQRVSRVELDVFAFAWVDRGLIFKMQAVYCHNLRWVGRVQVVGHADLVEESDACRREFSDPKGLLTAVGDL
jgi:hypothetical protein